MVTISAVHLARELAVCCQLGDALVPRAARMRITRQEMAGQGKTGRVLSADHWERTSGSRYSHRPVSNHFSECRSSIEGA
jgi:hypothetical protein